MSVKDGKQIALTWDKNNEIILAIKCVLKKCTKMFSSVKYKINYNFYFIRHDFTWFYIYCILYKFYFVAKNCVTYLYSYTFRYCYVRSTKITTVFITYNILNHLCYNLYEYGMHIKSNGIGLSECQWNGIIKPLIILS